MTGAGVAMTTAGAGLAVADTVAVSVRGSDIAAAAAAAGVVCWKIGGVTRQ